jgi:muconolactone D-isomerase
MLFHVTMEVSIPHDLDPDVRARLVAEERERALELQRAGVWPQLWRIVGQYANVSIFEVGSGDELHDLLTSLPLYPYMSIEVTALAQHPSKLT